MEKIIIDTEMCNECGELLIKDAVTSFFLTVREGRSISILCSTCFQDKIMKSLKDISGRAADAIMEELTKE